MVIIQVVPCLRCIGILFAILFVLHGIVGPPLTNAGNYRPGEVLVQLRAGARSTVLSEHQTTLGLSKSRSLKSDRLIQLSLPVDMTVDEAVAQLIRDPDIVFAEPNYLLNPQTTPDDPLFGLQWGLANTGQTVDGIAGLPGIDIDALHAWELAANGQEIIVAVIDSGCALDHPDLADRIWTNGYEIPDNNVDDDDNGYVDDIHGWDVVDNDNAPWNANGHGTRMAGVIAAQSNNGLGISGVNDLARILPVRFIDVFENGTVADAITAIEYALDQGAKIINCSWGGTGYSTALYNTIAAAADVLFVCAAGNYSTNTDEVGFYPASYELDNVLSVAALDQKDQLAAFSSYGLQTVDVAAPGVRIYTLEQDRQSVWEDDFDTGNLVDWSTGGTYDQWHVDWPPYTSNNSALFLSESNNYADNADNWVQSPPVDLTYHRACMLEFSITGASEVETDLLYVEISTEGHSWRNLPVKIGGKMYANGVSGSFPYWRHAAIDLGAWDGVPQIWLRLHFRSNESISDGTYQIDDLKLTSSNAGNIYDYVNGTSVAAAFVSGVGSLIQSLRPDLKAPEVIDIIQKTVDQGPNFETVLASGGRINAYRALVNTNDYETINNEPVDGNGSGGCFMSVLIHTGKVPISLAR